MSYVWDPERLWYVDEETGEEMPLTLFVQYRDMIAELMGEDIGKLVDSFLDEEIDLEGFKKRLQELIHDGHGVQYVFGRGGRDQMTEADWEILGRAIDFQYGRLDEFLEDVEAGNVTAEKLRWRSLLYAGGSLWSSGRGRARVYGVELPAYPGDCTSECCVGCKCYWELRVVGNVLEAFWHTTGNESCATCVDRNEQWFPYRIVLEVEDND